MKNLAAWFNKNKGAIATIVTGFLSISDLAFNWILGEKTVYVLGFNLLGVIGAVASLIIAVCTYGFHSVKVQEVIDGAIEIFKRDKNNGLTIQERNMIGKKINQLEKQIVKLKDEYKSYIDNVEIFQIATPDDTTKYNEYKIKVAKLSDMISKLKQRLGE